MSRFSTSSLVVLCTNCAAMLLVSSSFSIATEHAATTFHARARAVVELVRDNFYDASVAEKWARENLDYAAAATSEAQFVRLTRAALAELKVSHLAYWTRDDPQYWAMLGIFGGVLSSGATEYDGIGIDTTDDGFIRVVFGGSPAAAARLKRGDRILAVDGEPFHPVKSFRNKAGKHVELMVQRSAAHAPVQVTTTPRRINAAEEWLDHQKLYTRIMKRHGRRIGYVPMFSGAGEQYERALRESLAGELSDAEALVLDFRYGWGGLNASFVDIFNQQRPALVGTNRKGECMPRGAPEQPWTRPVYILTGAGTRSGKEVVCYALQKHRRATLIGEPTAGAVLGGWPRLMPDGAILMIPVEEILCDGERLEGRPIKPDVEVMDVVHFAGGADPVLERSLQLASEQLNKLKPE